LGSLEEPPGGETLYRQATQASNPNLWVFDEMLGDDEYSLGNTNPFGSIFMVLRFWSDFDHRGTRVNG